MDSKLDRVLHDLRILARVPRNGRIRKSSMGRVTLESNDYLVSLRRRYNQDSREQAIKDISAIFSDAFGEVAAVLSHRHMAALPAVPPPPPPFVPQSPTYAVQMPPALHVPHAHHPLFDGPGAGPASRGASPPVHVPPAPAGAEHDDERRRLLNSLSILYRDMLAAIEGVQMLKLTYSDDIAMVTQLDRLIEKVHLCLHEIRTKVPADVLAEHAVAPTTQETMLDKV